jgi:hypothetical protein
MLFFSLLMYPVSLMVYCYNVISPSLFVNLSFLTYPISFCNDF